MAIDDEQVRRIAELAGIELDPEETPRLAGELEKILAYVAALDELPATGRDAPTPEQPGLLRPDEPGPSTPVDQALSRAAATARGHFRVPRVLDE